MKKIRILFLFFILFNCNRFVSQEFSYKEIPKEYNNISKISSLEVENLKSTTFRGAVNLESYLPKNHNRFGRIDYTNYLQKGLDENSLVILPNFPVLINNVGLIIRANSKILFQTNSSLIMKPNDKEFYSALTIDNIENAEIYFAKLVGERYQHLNKKGEWGMGIYINNSKNIKIFNSKISNFWGDGIYIGRNNALPSENIEILGSHIDNNRRNGISIIAGKNIVIKNSIISNTNGTSPEYALDIEPNDSEDDINNLTIQNVLSYNNKKGGILMALDNLQGKPIKPILINISNFENYYSENGIGFYFDRGYKEFYAPLAGKITIKNVNIKNTLKPIETAEGKKPKIIVQLDKIKVNDKSKNQEQINKLVEKINLGKSAILSN